MKNTPINGCAGLLTALTLAGVNQASAQNLPPPLPPVGGSAILNLDGTPVLPGTTTYSANFIATSPESVLTFVFRHDPGFFTFDNATAADISTPGPNEIVNGTFTAPAVHAPGGGAPGWAYFVQAGNNFPGYLGYELTGGGWFDGATQAYDGIYQSIPTIPGDIYQVTFGLSQTDNQGVPYQTYSQISNNGDTTDVNGNGVDVVLYEGNGTPVGNSAPDSGSTMSLLSLGLIGLGSISRKLRR